MTPAFITARSWDAEVGRKRIGGEGGANGDRPSVQKAAKDRIVPPEAVIAAAPDVILASWCGKKVVPDKIRQRAGWSRDCERIRPPQGRCHSHRRNRRGHRGKAGDIGDPDCIRSGTGPCGNGPGRQFVTAGRKRHRPVGAAN
jgi:hypothetical protein